MKHVIFGMVLSAVALSTSVAKADSPLTSTDFHLAYAAHCKSSGDVKLCKLLDKKKMDKETAQYISDDRISLDKRLAVVNAIGWDFYGKSTAQQYKSLIGKSSAMMTAPELVALGYMMALDNYLDNGALSRAYEVASLGAKRIPKNFAAQAILALIEAQLDMHQGEQNWKLVWMDYERVLLAIPSYERNMLPAAEKIIREYMILYKD